ncbi:MAG: tetratricopeptide repeat protein [Deltaproteobacteria bacterium]|nr:tetratricopeptide repeat protein [Deltaproteobacteria bacterium]
MPRLLPLLAFPLLVACVTAREAERARAQVDLGAAYLKEGSTESAIASLTEATRLDPRSWAAWSHLGMAMWAKGRPEQAEEALRKAVRLAGGRAEPHLNLGVVLFGQGRVDESIAQYEAALQDLTYRKPALVLNDLGFALYARGEYERAEAVLAEAVERAPNFCPARFNLGLVQRARQDAAAALATFDRVLAICPDEAVGAYFQAGTLLLDGGETARGATYLEQVLERAPDTEAARAAAVRLQEAGLR